MHPYARAALIGLVVGIVVGVAFYAILRAFGTTANRYLLVAIVIFFIPGGVMLSILIEGTELDEDDWKAEQAKLEERQRSVPPKSER
jgi:high-affinity Fe2+/Pb2+ permease